MSLDSASATGTRSRVLERLRATPAPVLVAGLAFVLLFWQPMRTLARDWWSDPDAGQGLLLGPLAVYLAWRSGLVDATHHSPRTTHRIWGLTILTGAVVLRYLSGLAAELFTMRLSLLAAAVGLIVFVWGWGQVRRWWLPAVLLLLSIPIPAVILNTVAFPLQLKASQMGAWLMHARHVPVVLAGNVIHLPGRSLFVTEACSGLRSLTALLALGVLIGGLWLSSTWGRALLVVAAVPVALVLNGLRVFLTGFLVYYVSPKLGDGFLHLTEGWVIFVIAFAILGGIGWIVAKGEHTLTTRRPA